MTTRIVPSEFATIQLAINASANGDTILIEAGHSNEAASVTVENLIFEGAAPTSIGIVLTLAAGIAQITLQGDAPIIVTGNDSDNIIIGNSGNNIFAGGEGDDNLNGGLGQDTFTYIIGEGADIFNGGTGNDGAGDLISIYGGAGADTLSVVVADGVINSVAGIAFSNIERFGFDLGGGLPDALSYTTTTQDVTVNLLTATGTGFISIAGVEVVTGGAGNDSITGAGGADVLIGGGGADAINGGEGNDTITGSAGNDTLNGGAGQDDFFYTIGDGADAVDGGTGSDGAGDLLQITGTAGDDSLSVVVVGGVITMAAGGAVSNVERVALNFGGSGTDTVSFAGTSQDLAIDLATEVATAFVMFNEVDNATGGSGNDTITGSSINNILNGGGGNDTINAGAGEDAINYTAGDGADTVDGGTGSDGAGDLLAILGTTGNDTAAVLVVGGVITTVGGGAVSNIERFSIDLDNGTDMLSYAGTAQDVSVDLINLTATGFTSVGFTLEGVTGGAGNDTLVANNNGNTLNGGAGNDTLSSGGGPDTLNGGDGQDTFRYFRNSGSDVIDGGTGNDGAGDRLNIEGSGGTDSITVRVTGGIITGVGTSGTVTNIERVVIDLLGGGNDSLNYSTTAQDVAVNLGAGTATGFNSFANVENITGGAGDDTITGSNANNTLNGGDGNDTLDGSGGADTLGGGDGDDIFQFSPAPISQRAKRSREERAPTRCGPPPAPFSISAA